MESQPIVVLPLKMKASDDQVESLRFPLRCSPTTWGQFKALLRKELLMKTRSITATSVPFLVPVWILFILLVLNSSLTRGIAAPVLQPFRSLTSKCTTSDCIAMGYVRTSGADAIITNLNTILQQSEPGSRLQEFESRNALLSYHTNNPRKMVVGVEFLNLAALAAPSPNVTVDEINLRHYTICIRTILRLLLVMMIHACYELPSVWKRLSPIQSDHKGACLSSATFLKSHSVQ
jgi:hypothetical protein